MFNKVSIRRKFRTPMNSCLRRNGICGGLIQDTHKILGG